MTSTTATWRATDLAAALHDVANRLAVYDGPLPSSAPLLSIHCGGAMTKLLPKAVNTVDALGEALFGQAGATKKNTSTCYEHEAAKTLGPLDGQVYAWVPPPVEEDPAALRAEIADLKAQLAAQGGDQ